jgi:fumarate reductase subunit C
LHALSRGEASYAEFQGWLKTPLALALNVMGLFFVLFHTITWFNLAPRAMPMHVRDKRVPDWLLAAPNYVAWLAFSALIAWFVLGG